VENIDIKNFNFEDNNNKYIIPVSVSNKHVHLCQADLDALFGSGYQLTPSKDLSQPGQFAAEETINIVGMKGILEGVRILGPLRSNTQVELAQTDARKVGIKAPLRNSGDVKGSPGAVLVGPKGYVVLEQGCIVANLHIHLHSSEGAELGIADQNLVDVYIKGDGKYVCFQNVLVRIGDSHKKDMHIDTDEGNAARVGKDAKGLIVKRS